MATYTTNYNLEKPEASDPFGDFRQSYNDNMDIIDQNLGGGGGGGGHTIVDENGSDMPAESKLQFTGNVSVTDDNVNGATVVDVLGGGGAVLGAFVDTNRLLVPTTSFQTSYSYTATEDCFVCLYVVPKENDDVHVDIDGEKVVAWWRGSAIADETTQYVRKGQTISVVNAHSSYNSFIWVYGLLQGTNGIFAPVIYSDNERVIGVWRDNKPLYQKTYSGLSISCANQGVWYSTGQNYGDIENIVFCEIVDQYGQRISGSAGYMSQTPKPIALNLALDNRVVKAFTIQYTKTTDVAGSGNWNTDGVPTHHYSTSEQVIGTWIDGKPIYERTWDFSASPVMLSYANWVNSGISASENIQSIISAELKYGTVTNMAVEVAVGADGYPVAFQKVENTGNTRGVAYCTLRYTKTTD